MMVMLGRVDIIAMIILASMRHLRTVHKSIPFMEEHGIFALNAGGQESGYVPILIQHIGLLINRLMAGDLFPHPLTIGATFPILMRAMGIALVLVHCCHPGILLQCTTGAEVCHSALCHLQVLGKKCLCLTP